MRNDELTARPTSAFANSCKFLAGVVVGCFLVLADASGQSNNVVFFSTIAGATNYNENLDGFGSGAHFEWPTGIAIGTNGYAYCVDQNASTVRQIAPASSTWHVTTIAGSADNSTYGDGTGQNALFNEPEGIAVDSSNNLYIADFGNSCIRKLTLANGSWVSSTIAGMVVNKKGVSGYLDGTNTATQFGNPNGIAVDAVGNLYVADTENNLIRMVTPVGTNWVVTTIAGDTNNMPFNYGSVDGTNLDAQFNLPYDIVVDSSGNLFVADGANSTIREITPVGTNWVVTTIAGVAGNLGLVDGTNTDALFDNPYGIAVDAQDNLYVADTYNNAIRKIAPVGTNWVTTTLAGGFGYPGPDNGSADGVGTNALFKLPSGIAVDSMGTIYVADSSNHEIRMGIAATLPNLTLSQMGASTVLISWPGSFGVLQTNADLSSGNWGTYSGAINFNNGTNVVTISPPVGNLFFRLTTP